MNTCFFYSANRMFPISRICVYIDPCWVSKWNLLTSSILYLTNVLQMLVLHTRHPHSLTPEDCLWFEALAPSPMSFEKACRAFPAPGQHMAFGQAVFCWGCSKYIDVSSNKATTLQCSVNISASGIGVQVVFPPNLSWSNPGFTPIDLKLKQPCPIYTPKQVGTAGIGIRYPIISIIQLYFWNHAKSIGTMKGRADTEILSRHQDRSWVSSHRGYPTTISQAGFLQVPFKSWWPKGLQRTAIHPNVNHPNLRHDHFLVFFFFSFFSGFSPASSSRFRFLSFFSAFAPLPSFSLSSFSFFPSFLGAFCPWLSFFSYFFAFLNQEGPGENYAKRYGIQGPDRAFVSTAQAVAHLHGVEVCYGSYLLYEGSKDRNWEKTLRKIHPSPVLIRGGVHCICGFLHKPQATA